MKAVIGDDLTFPAGSQLESFRKSGIPFIRDIPWGTHLSVFYESDDDLPALAIPFLATGLENNEFCIWIVDDSLSPSAALQLLQKNVPALKRTQIEVMTPADWYLQYGGFRGDRIIAGWIEKIEAALAQGYEGIRVCGSTAWLREKHWKKFLAYEQEIQKAIGFLKLIALCPYQLSKCELPDILDIVRNHHFSFLKNNIDWKYLNSTTSYEHVNLMGKMAANVAHEIRNPLTTVRGFIQLLGKKYELSLYRDYFTLMLEELDRANVTIAEYLSLTKELEKDIKLHDLNEIVHTILPLLQADAVTEGKDVVFPPEKLRRLLWMPGISGR
ncbi:MAG: hypothetical protein GX200_08255 [Firmicutes bacterium]|nr:hypothetical protein [Bacillota bacterium]